MHGYKPILDAAKSFVRGDEGGVVFEGKKSKAEGELGGKYISGTKGSGTGSCGRPCGCCEYTPAAAVKSLADESSSDEVEISSETSITETEEVPLPALQNEKKVWFRPTAIELLVELKHVYPSAKIVAGSSEVQVEVKFKHEKYGVSVYVSDIEGLKGFSIDEEKRQVVIGGNTSLTVPEMACLEGYKKLGKRGFVLEAIRKKLRYFASRQLWNTATPTGNIVTTSPISDLNPVLIASVRDSWRVSIADEEYFVAYKATAIPADAIMKLTIPLPAEGTREVIKFYKEAKRGDDDIAIVTAGLRVVLDESSVVTDISLAHGGFVHYPTAN
ncbi:hypothetical protein L873DRAFT_1847946 [Choiromyces venosus 120613-1]|uniref:FAD-binding PCMH-type domain-containing protein n=1 Tax=Choiromyces venosus 120613-1 TaxID=1336337 RepID=A0A3N4J1U4_9PEZI|nr:hypothetical protein L873DRAFT_1847946 [Choiromyces venosus 120613-1]